MKARWKCSPKGVFWLLAVLTATAGLFGAQDFRPPFDKRDYAGRVGIQLNPWFPPKKPPMHASGGPNVPYLHHEGTELQVWRQAMDLCARYGVDVLVPEINEPRAWTWQWRVLLQAAALTNDPPVKVGMFFGMYSKDKDAVIASMKKVLGPFREDLRSNPAVNRAGGHPVMVIYNPLKFKSAEWKEIFDALDAEFGRMVYLFNMNSLAVKVAQQGGDNASQDARFEKLLREMLPYWDGISSYGTGFRVPFGVIRKVMADFPQKINEGEAFLTYLNHFQTGGSEVELSETWRRRLAGCYSSDPDALLVTNLLDQHENSAVYPCYEREDLMLRYLEWTLGKWKRRKSSHVFSRMTTPELVVCNYTSVLLGWQNLDFEVLGFPMDAQDTRVKVMLDICDASGKVLHTFPARDMDLNDFRAERISVPSTQFAGERGVVPRLRYEWAGRKRMMNFGPMTLIDPSLRPYRMFWARSTKNALLVDGKNEWTLDGVGVGGTHRPSPSGLSQFSSRIKPTWHSGDASGMSRAGIRRDGVEFRYVEAPGIGLSSSLTIPVPPPGGALHWYHLEMENAKGRKFQTLPIWDEDGSRVKTVKVPVWKEDGSFAEFEIEDTRVPYWHYPVDDDVGPILLDVSGWEHHGRLLSGKSDYGGGHLNYTGYNHYHNGYAAPADGRFSKRFKRDPDGRGYLTFNGSNDYVMVMGGTAFPGAFTYELSVRPAALGREMGLLGTANGQVNVTLLADGALRVEKTGARDANGAEANTRFTRACVSSSRIEPGVWTKVAVTYDLRLLRLYVNGTACGEVSVGPMRNHERINHVTIGSKCGFVYEPRDFFKGDIRAVRMYGRNLAPEEFLK